MKFRLLCIFDAAASFLGEVACAALNVPLLDVEKTQTPVAALSSDEAMGRSY